MQRRTRSILALVLVLAILAACTTPSDTTLPGSLSSARQFGTSGYDSGIGIATDPNGRVFVGGVTTGDLAGINAGGFDAFVRSFASDGSVLWTTQYGTGGTDVVIGVASDASGNVFVTGFTTGALDGVHAGGHDAYVRSFDEDGALRWAWQFGTAAFDIGRAIAVDAGGNVYVAGATEGFLDGPSAGGSDAFLRSYDNDGNPRWARQFGTGGDDAAFGVATDAAGNVYATGTTKGAFEGLNAGGIDAFVRSFDTVGNDRWTRQFGTSGDDTARGIAATASGRVAVVGFTSGDLVAAVSGDADAFIRTYVGDGALLWARQFGTTGYESALGVALDASGNSFVVGYTDGTLGAESFGDWDAFVRSFDRDGAPRWTRQFGTTGFEEATAVAIGSGMLVYVVGNTGGALDGVQLGEGDPFLRAFVR
jgi:hypothetical protein